MPTPADSRLNFPDYREEGGAAMVEYSLILALIAVVAFGLVGAVGDAALDIYTQTANAIHAIFS